MVEHYPSKVLVIGSNPIRPIQNYIRGRITQLVECWFVTPKAASSILVSPENKIKPT